MYRVSNAWTFFNLETLLPVSPAKFYAIINLQTFFSFNRPYHELFHGVWEPWVCPSGHGVASLMLRLFADGKWNVGILHVLG